MVEIKDRKFTVILREEPEGGFSAQCVELPGAISQGDNRKEALTNIKEAIEGYLEAFPDELDQLKRKKELVEITEVSNYSKHVRLWFHFILRDSLFLP